MAEKKEIVKGRNWKFLLYPESLKNTERPWMDMWNELDIKKALSPVHDKDLKDGKSQSDVVVWENSDKTDEVLNPYKKPHYHGLFMFDGPVTEEYVQGILEPFLGPKKVLKAPSVGMALRYFTHKDNPDKAQYSDTDVLYSGIDYDTLVRIEKDDVKLIDDIIEFIDVSGLVYFSVLFRYAMRCKPEWKSVIIRYTHFLKEYLKSFEYEMNNTFDGVGFMKSYENIY